MTVIYHIARRGDWEAAQLMSVYAPVSLGAEGFIHMLTGEQVVGVADSVFRGEADLLLLFIDLDRVRELVRWEGLREYGEEYPHLYGSLPVDAVVRVCEFKPGVDGRFSLPE